MQVAVEFHNRASILFAVSNIGSSQRYTATPSSAAFRIHSSGMAAFSASTMQAASASVATATVFILPMTVTQAQSAGARAIARLSRSQQ